MQAFAWKWCSLCCLFRQFFFTPVWCILITIKMNLAYSNYQKVMSPVWRIQWLGVPKSDAQAIHYTPVWRQKLMPEWHILMTWGILITWPVSIKFIQLLQESTLTNSKNKRPPHTVVIILPLTPHSGGEVMAEWHKKELSCSSGKACKKWCHQFGDIKMNLACSN